MAILGVDISKETFDATLIDGAGKTHHRQFNNNETGFKRLERWLGKHRISTLHACLEATNIYWEKLAEFLTDKGYQVSVVNPARIKGFAVSQMQRNKNDKLDSQLIALFCAKMKPDLWRPPTPEQRQLRAMSRHLEGLKTSRTRYLNRLKTCDPIVRPSIQAIIDTLQQQIDLIEQQIQDLINQHPLLKRQHDLLCSIKGVGTMTAIKMMAEMHNLADYTSASAAAADAGLCPRQYQSGTSIRKRPKVSKVGKASIRGALYFPAITAMTHNPIVRQFCQRLLDRGKSKGVVIVAAMRKLMHISYGVLKNDTPFDPAYAC